MFDLFTIAAVVGTFALAGAVKGVIGLGLPTISIALLTVAIDLPSAMALLIAPSFVTNLWQAVVGGNGILVLLRIWPFLATATATVWIGAAALTRLDNLFLSGLLGGLLVAYAGLSLAGLRLTISRSAEAWAGPALGVTNGVLTGMTGSFVVPGVMFLQSIGLSRDMLVQAMGMLFLASTVALALALNSEDLLTVEFGIASVSALIPTAAGMIAGQRIRRRLSEARFRQVFFTAVLVLGAYLLGHAALG